jgi:hypothetical protein
MKNLLMIVGLLMLLPAVWYVQIWVIHWAISLFYPISMWQAFGISVLLSIFGSAFNHGLHKRN